jgi:RHS repeat-associated protein
MERDLEDNTEHAQFRQYSTNLGRWQSPDLYLGSYDFTNPQSFNRYTYALNNPANLVDPSGLAPCVVGIYDPNCGGSVPGGDKTPTFVVITWSLGQLEDWVKGLGLGQIPTTNLGTIGVGSRGSSRSAPNNGQRTSFKNCATQKLKPQLSANLNTWRGQLKQAPLFGVVGAAGVTGALVIAEPETLPVAPAVFGVLAVNLTIYAADVSTTYAAGKSILQIGAAAMTCGVQTF